MYLRIFEEKDAYFELQFGTQHLNEIFNSI
jgi:hypothetical protein